MFGSRVIPRVSSLLALLVLLACSAGGNATAIIHKCIDASGIASYQTMACAQEQQQVWSRSVAGSAPSSATAQPSAGKLASKRSGAGAGYAAADHSDGKQPLGMTPTAARAKRGRVQRNTAGKDRRADGTAQAALIPLNSKAASSSCVSARRRRDDTLARVGMKRSYALLQKLDDNVQRACQ